MPERLKTGKIFICLLTIAILAVSAPCLRAQGRVIHLSEADIAHQAVDESALRSQLEFLTDSLCAGRATGTAGANAATFWLAAQFRSLGLQAPGGSYIRHFRANGKTGRNVLGILRGSQRHPDAGYVILAASYDGLGILDGRMYPGADSNASGITALLGVARMIRSMQRIGKNYGRNVLLVAIDGKNLSLSGSQALFDMLGDGSLTDPATGRAITRDRIALFVNLDQLGSTLSPIHAGRPDYLLMLTGATGTRNATLDACNTRYGTGLDLGYDYYGSRDFTRLFYSRVSDQRPFVEGGIPAVMFTSGITLNNNKVQDTLQTLDLSVLKRRIWLIFHWMERII